MLLRESRTQSAVTREAASAAPAPAAPPPAAAKPEAEVPSIVRNGKLPPVLLSGIDLNSATAEDLVTRLEGIGEGIAERIVRDRTENGPFYALYDLARVPGVGSKAFERITGWKWHEDIYGQLATVNRVLDRWEGGLPDLNQIAERFIELTGFEGCVVVHIDGHLLASNWNARGSAALEAMAPQIIKRVAQYMKHVCPGEPMSVTVMMEERIVAISQNDDIVFVGIRSPRAFNRRHLQIVQGMAMALGKRFSGLRDA